MKLTLEERKHRKAISDKKYYEKNKKIILEWQKKYNEKNKESRRIIAQKWRLKNSNVLKTKANMYYRKHSESIKNRVKEYYVEKRDMKLRYAKEYREKNKETIAGNYTRWRKRNMEKINSRHREYVEKHPEKRLMWNVKYLTKIGNELKLPCYNYQYALSAWCKTVKFQQGDKCWCGSDDQIQVHHIFHKVAYPKLSLNPNNGIPLCAKHHYEVHGKCLTK